MVKPVSVHVIYDGVPVELNPIQIGNYLVKVDTTALDISILVDFPPRPGEPVPCSTVNKEFHIIVQWFYNGKVPHISECVFNPMLPNLLVFLAKVLYEGKVHIINYMDLL